jgi:hypothetical protein
MVSNSWEIKTAMKMSVKFEFKFNWNSASEEPY